MLDKLAQFGRVDPPPGVSEIGDGGIAGIPLMVNLIIRSLIVVASVYAMFNLVLAGYWYISAAGDSKRIAEASSKIWQTVIGLVVAGGAVMLAGLIGEIFFGDAGAILDLKIITAN